MAISLLFLTSFIFQRVVCLKVCELMVTYGNSVQPDNMTGNIAFVDS